MSRIAILGGGSWGTALAIALSRTHKPHAISLWVRDRGAAESIAETRENTTYLPNCSIPREVEITADMAAALSQATIVVGAVPAAHARQIYGQALPLVGADTVLVSATKGLEPNTHLRMSEVIFQVCAHKSINVPAIAVLSGPSFALEVARGNPTAVVVASRRDTEAKPAEHIQSEFAAPPFRLYTNNDVLGVELAGAMKNVIAIAAGTCHGLELGHNAIAALITRGLAEMCRLAKAMGAQAETLNGLAGLGDLVLTCTGALSRNRQLGVELGRGGSVAGFLSRTRMVAEGVGTAAALLALARDHAVELPITEQVEAILHGGKSPCAAIAEIMERPQKPESPSAAPSFL